MRQRIQNSFKSKLFILFLVVGLVPLIASTALYQNIIDGMILESSESASIENLKYVSFNIKRQADTAERLLDWIVYNQRLQQILLKDYSELYEWQLDVIDFSSDVTEYAINASIEDSVRKILIVDNDGHSFQLGNSYSYLKEEQIVEAGWMDNFQKELADELILGQDWYMQEGFVFPMSRRIYNHLTGKPLGWCLIVFEDTLYSDILTEGGNGTEAHTFAVNARGQCIADGGLQRLGMDLSDNFLVREILSQEDTEGHVIGEYDGEPSILHYYRIPDTNIVEIRAALLEEFQQERQRMIQLSAVFTAGTAAVIILVILYLGNVLMRPINRICDYLKTVPRNGFKGDLKLNGDDEFQKIAASINNMEREILHLMETQKREEEVKKQLEFKVLQNQINPHFLYNTLNSIKWMATLQHADTIRDMTAALGRLLQNISKGANAKIPIYEEMSLLDDYILIQDVRYDGRIQVEYHIGNGAITSAYILKFLLQPIVENAIFHGIEPKGEQGKIDIYLVQDEEDIVIEVKDDGVGMDEEQIQALLDPVSPVRNERGLNGIGILNIHQRIQMVYGERYGLKITSQPGCFTCVTIRIPYEKEG